MGYQDTLSCELQQVNYLCKMVNAGNWLIALQSVGMMGPIRHPKPWHGSIDRHLHIKLGIADHQRLLGLQIKLLQ